MSMSICQTSVYRAIRAHCRRASNALMHPLLYQLYIRFTAEMENKGRNQTSINRADRVDWKCRIEI